MPLTNEITWPAFDARLAETPYRMERRQGEWWFVHRETGDVMRGVYRTRRYRSKRKARRKPEVGYTTTFHKKGTIEFLEGLNKQHPGK